MLKLAIFDHLRNYIFQYLRYICVCFCLPEEGLLYLAHHFGDSDLYQRAQRMGTPTTVRDLDHDTGIRTHRHTEGYVVMVGTNI